ncbi:MAG: toll/interleukin-1 receptor domain-containing protein [Atopobiaceae bacterium]|nr:toll/interleukin-1 receptor domain-containing protein [Atopobiaceae bacterium]
MRCKAVSYEGPEQYIFISYAHRDSDRVFPVIERLAADGFRIWFDEGIDPGSEWISNIGEHLSAASAVISFLSENSISSQNCREEIMFARDTKIPVLTIYLEDVQIDHGLKLALMSYQAVFMQSYDEGDQFYRKVEGARMLEPCHRLPMSEEPTPTVDSNVIGERENAESQSLAQPTHDRKTRKPIAIALVAVVVVAVFAIAGIAIFGPGEDEGPSASNTSTPANQQVPADAIDQQEVSESTDEDEAKEESSVNDEDVAAALADPDSHRGETVKLCAAITMAPDSSQELFDGAVYLLHPSGHEDFLLLPESEQSLLSGEVTEESYVFAEGTLDAKDGKGYLKDATLTTATYVDYASPTTESVDVKQSDTQSNVTLTVDKVEFAEDETRVYYTIKNDRSAPIGFETPVIEQDSDTYVEDAGKLKTAERSNQQLPNECAAESDVSGFVEYKPMESRSFTATLKLTSPDKVTGVELSVTSHIVQFTVHDIEIEPLTISPVSPVTISSAS